MARDFTHESSLQVITAQVELGKSSEGPLSKLNPMVLYGTEKTCDSIKHKNIVFENLNHRHLQVIQGPSCGTDR